jgi:hypothetical protein
MATGGVPRTNFGFLEVHDEQARPPRDARRALLPDYPNTSLLKLRQLTELLAQLVATRVGIYTSREEVQYDLVPGLQDQGILPREGVEEGDLGWTRRRRGGGRRLELWTEIVTASPRGHDLIADGTSYTRRTPPQRRRVPRFRTNDHR